MVNAFESIVRELPTSSAGPNPLAAMIDEASRSRNVNLVASAYQDFNRGNTAEAAKPETGRALS